MKSPHDHRQFRVDVVLDHLGNLGKKLGRHRHRGQKCLNKFVRLHPAHAEED